MALIQDAGMSTVGDSEFYFPLLSRIKSQILMAETAAKLSQKPGRKGPSINKSLELSTEPKNWRPAGD